MAEVAIHASMANSGVQPQTLALKRFRDVDFIREVLREHTTLTALTERHAGQS